MIILSLYLPLFFLLYVMQSCHSCKWLLFCDIVFRSPTESRKRYEEKHAKAQELREKLLQEKAERLRDLSKKVSQAAEGGGIQEKAERLRDLSKKVSQAAEGGGI